MKATKIIYWTLTSIVSIMSVISAYAYFTNEQAKMGFHHLGYPDYFRIELGIAKIVGAILLVAPVPLRIKEWTYAGFGIVYVSAFIAHNAIGDPLKDSLGSVVFLVLLASSYLAYHKVEAEKSILRKTFI